MNNIIRDKVKGSKSIYLTSFLISLSLIFIISCVSADTMVWNGGSGSTTGSQNAIGAYHWSCFNFSSNATAPAQITNIQGYIAVDNSLDGIGSAFGIYNINATGGVNGNSQVGTNTTNKTTYALGFSNWTFPSPFTISNFTQYWACAYTGSSNYIRLGETGGTPASIWARDSNDNINRLSLGAAIQYINMQIFANIANDPVNINVTLVSPPDNSLQQASELNFISYANSSGTLKNATLYLWYNNGSLSATSKSDINPATNNKTVSIHLAPLLNATYKWNVQYCATNSTGTGCFFAPSNFTFINFITPATSTGIFPLLHFDTLAGIAEYILLLALGLSVMIWINYEFGCLVLLLDAFIATYAGQLIIGIVVLFSTLILLFKGDNR